MATQVTPVGIYASLVRVYDGLKQFQVEVAMSAGQPVRMTCAFGPSDGIATAQDVISRYQTFFYAYATDITNHRLNDYPFQVTFFHPG